MSYNYQTQWDSPNFTKGYNSRKFIVIHWWDDPANNPSYEGTITTLLRPTRDASAHYIATGTDRRVACIVSPEDTAWHAGVYPPKYNVNPDSIGIECDPRCRDEDYDVVAELIANIRSAYGDLPLRRHSDFAPTRCPGDWDLGRLEALSRTKDGSGDWGVVTNIVTTSAPEPLQPVVVPEPVVEPPKPVETVPEPLKEPKNIIITSNPDVDNPTYRYMTFFEIIIRIIKEFINNIRRK